MINKNYLKKKFREYLNDLSVRLKSIFYLLDDNNKSRKEAGPLQPVYFTKLIESLIRKDKDLIGNSTKLYINSQIHRERFRLWQTLLSVYSRLSQVCCFFLFYFSKCE